MSARRSRIIRWVLVPLAVLVLAGCPLGVYLCDRHWERKYEAKLAELRQKGLLVDPEVIRNRAEELPPEENSALLYIEALDHLQEVPTHPVVDGTTSALPLGTTPSPMTLELLEAEMECNAEALKLMAEAAKRGEGTYPVPDGATWLGLATPDTDAPRVTGRLAGRRALLRASRGDADGAAGDIALSLAASRSFGHKVSMIEQLSRIALQSVALSDLNTVLALGEPSLESLARLRTMLRAEQDLISMKWPLRVEVAVFLQSIGGPTPGRRPTSGGPYAPIPSWTSRVPGWFEGDILLYLTTMEECYDALDAPPAERMARTREVCADARSTAEESPLRHLLARPFLPEHRSIRSSVSALLHLRVADAALAVEQFRRTHGRWPESLDELVPEFCTAAPVDPITGGTLRYRRTPEGVLVYSLGTDGNDDGGVGWQDPEVDRETEPHEWDIPFRLLDPELRGAEPMTFREEVMSSSLHLNELKEAGFEEERLRELGFTDRDLKILHHRPYWPVDLEEGPEDEPGAPEE